MIFISYEYLFYPFLTDVRATYFHIMPLVPGGDYYNKYLLFICYHFNQSSAMSDSTWVPSGNDKEETSSEEEILPPLSRYRRMPLKVNMHNVFYKSYSEKC